MTMHRSQQAIARLAEKTNRLKRRTSKSDFPGGLDISTPVYDGGKYIGRLSDLFAGVVVQTTGGELESDEHYRLAIKVSPDPYNQPLEGAYVTDGTTDGALNLIFGLSSQTYLSGWDFSIDPTGGDNFEPAGLMIPEVEA